MTEQTATIRVFEPCDCRACAADKPWFSCEQYEQRHIATYQCDPIGEEDPLIPHPLSIAHVREQHPAAILVYLDA